MVNMVFFFFFFFFFVFFHKDSLSRNNQNKTNRIVNKMKEIS